MMTRRSMPEIGATLLAAGAGLLLAGATDLAAALAFGAATGLAAVTPERAALPDTTVRSPVLAVGLAAALFAATGVRCAAAAGTLRAGAGVRADGLRGADRAGIGLRLIGMAVLCVRKDKNPHPTVPSGRDADQGNCCGCGKSDHCTESRPWSASSMGTTALGGSNP